MAPFCTFLLAFCFFLPLFCLLPVASCSCCKLPSNLAACNLFSDALPLPSAGVGGLRYTDEIAIADGNMMVDQRIPRYHVFEQTHMNLSLVLDCTWLHQGSCTTPAGFLSAHLFGCQIPANSGRWVGISIKHILINGFVCQQGICPIPSRAS